MKKIYFLGILLFASFFLAACNLNQGKDQTVSQPKEENNSFIGTLKEAISSGKSLKCQWSHEGNSGTTYIKGNQYYAHYETEGKKGNMIFKDNCLWTWEEDQNQGFNMCFEENIMENEQEEQVQNQGKPELSGNVPSQDYQYNCQIDLVGDDKFTLPAGVNFLNSEQMMQGQGMMDSDEN